MRRLRRHAARTAPVAVPRNVSAEGSVARTMRAGRGAERWGSRRDLRTMVEGTMSLGDVSVGNTLTLLRNGDENFRLMWRLMREATKSIYVQTYTLEPDDVGLRTLQELEHAAERGLDVRLIFDRLGSIEIDSSHLERLRELRAKVIEYDPRSYWRFGFLHRNHRKICVIDEKTAIVGGMNVSNDYAGPEAGGSNFFVDANVRVEGPAVLDFRDVYLASERLRGSTKQRFFARLSARWKEFSFRDFFKRRGVERKRRKALTQPWNPEMGGMVQVLESNVRRERKHIQRSLPQIIRCAKLRMYVASPYFIPSRAVRRAMMAAARRGVDVRVVTAGRTDVTMAKHAARHVTDELLSAGVRVFEMRKQALHAKLLVVDDLYTTVGSFNLDVMSSSRNLEMSMHVLESSFARQVRDHTVALFKMSHELFAAQLPVLAPTRIYGNWLNYLLLRAPQGQRWFRSRFSDN
jgi:cardiolipin synthase